MSIKRRIANCPACAGPIEFRLSTSLVTVCDYCQSVVARTDKRLEDLGKVADLAETGSPLQRGLTGVFEKKAFEIVGFVQYQHPAGGVWTEWYLKFPADKVRWLAEAQGKWYLLVEKKLAENVSLPEFDSLEPGHRFELAGGQALIVAERGIATAKSAGGEIPWAFRPNAEHRFADLHGARDEFATIEYARSGPRIFFGREVSLDELHLSGDGWTPPTPETANTAAMQVSCPHCAAPLALHAPDQTERVCCPSCHSLLDCQQGKLQYLQTLKLPVTKPVIPLGSVGKLFDIEFTVIGFMERFAVWEGTKFPWTEYLLHNPAKGFRWLVRNQGHWSYVGSLPVSAATESTDTTAVYEGKTFRLYDRGTAHVRYVAGEFYWRVSVNEQVISADYIAPPRMLSFERTVSNQGTELNVSLGEYIEKEALEEAFGVKDIPPAFGVGTIQPQTKRGDVWLTWVATMLLLIVLDFAFVNGAVKKPVNQFFFFMAMVGVSLLPIGMFFARHAFEVNRWKDSDYNPYASADSGDGGDDE